MKSQMALKVFVLIIAGSLNAMASMDESPSLATEVKPVEAPSKSHVAVGLRTVSFNYEEPGLMSEKGILYGVGSSYFYQITNGVLFRADGELLSGKTQYKGGLQDGAGNSTPYESKSSFRTTNLSGMAVFSSNFSESFVTAPMLGFGYRNTFDGKDGQYDYRRDITYYYMIYGLQFEVINNPKNILLLQVEVDNLIGGSAKTYLSDVSEDFGDVDLKFRSGLAYKLGAEYYYTLANAHKIYGELSYKQWQVADSKPAQSNGMYFIEPENKTSLMSLTIGYLF